MLSYSMCVLVPFRVIWFNDLSTLCFRLPLFFPVPLPPPHPLSSFTFPHSPPLRGNDSHMWTARTMISFLDVLEVEIRKRRMELGLSRDAKALVICDKAPQHLSRTFASLRRSWSDKVNCYLLGADPDDPISVPSGFGACGGPNDGWHQHFHALRRAIETQ